MGIEEGSRKQMAAILEGDALATMEVAGEHEVITEMPRAFPNPRIVGTKDLHISAGERRRVGAGHADRSGTVRHVGNVLMNPAAAGGRNSILDALHADVLVVIASDGKDGRDPRESLHQVPKGAEFFRMVDEIAAQEQQIQLAGAGRHEDLSRQGARTSSAEVDIADVQDAAWIRMSGEMLMADVEGMVLADGQALHEASAL